MTLDIGRIGIWTGVLDGQPTSKAQEVCQEIEALGYTTLWIPEAVGRDPFVAAANYLAATSTLKLATGIANIYARDPMTMAACQNTLAEAYPNRFLLGLGVSHHHLVERLRKHDYSKPLTYMKQYLTDMDGAMFAAVKPAEKPGTVLAALGPKMLETSVAQADGAHPYFTTPEHTAFSRETMGAGLLAPEMMCCLESDPTKAREIAKASMQVYLRAPNYQNNLKRIGFTDADWADPANPSDKLVDAIVAWGSADAIKARVDEHFAAGADHVCIQVLAADREAPVHAYRELAAALL